MPRSLAALLFVCLPALAVAEEKPAYQTLFDGETLDGWDGLDQFWSVKDGVIVGQTTDDNPTDGNTFLIWQNGDVSDFEFRAEVRFEGNNSGVQYRSEIVDPQKFVLKGYQADLHPNQDYFGMMYGEKTGRGIIATRGSRIAINAEGKTTNLGQLDTSTQFKNDEWNEITIYAVGNRLIHQINGQTTVDIIDEHPEAAASGKLGLQLHAGPAMKVEFRNIRLRQLSGNDAATVIEKATADE